jgi:hypothetical protein
VLVASAASPVVAQALREGPGAEATVRDVVRWIRTTPRHDAQRAVSPVDPRVASGSVCCSAGWSRAAGRCSARSESWRPRADSRSSRSSARASDYCRAIPGAGSRRGAHRARHGTAAAGLARLIGPPGLALAAVAFLLVGNPGSGNASAPELLPGFWRAVGPLLLRAPGARHCATSPYSTARRSRPAHRPPGVRRRGRPPAAAGRSGKPAHRTEPSAPEPYHQVRHRATPSLSA